MSHHRAEENNSYGAGDQDCIRSQLSMPQSCELHFEK